MHDSWLTPDWRGRRCIEHPVKWTRLPEFDVGVAYIQTRVDHGHENRWFLYARRFNEADVQSQLVMAQTVVTTTAVTQDIVSDATWNNANNEVEVIGGGASGAHGASTSTSGGGGGGGAYSKIINASITTPGTTHYYARVGVGGGATDGTAGGDSWWTLSSPGTTFPASGTAVGAKGGVALTGTSATGSAGGALASAYASPATGAVKTSGGKGGNAGASNASGGGGGGAGGEAGDGGSPGTGPSAGGAGNANTSGGGTSGAAGNPGTAGGAGTNIDGVNGSGGGGGGGNASASTGGNGGLYGGGGGGGGRSTGNGGAGVQGIVVLTWTPPAVAHDGSALLQTIGLLATIPASVRVVPEKGSALLATASALAASATGLVTITGGTGAELLLHLDGTDASTSFPDSGGGAHTVTAHGSAQVDTGQAVFAGQALQVASAADYLDVAAAGAFGAGDFCIDFRARLSSASEAPMFYDGGDDGPKLYYDGSALKFESVAGTITGAALSADTNYHIAATRAGTSTRLWLDGSQQGSTLTDATDYTVISGYPRIGGMFGLPTLEVVQRDGQIIALRDGRTVANDDSMWWLDGAAVDLDFQSQLYQGGALTSLLSCTRASTGYAQTAAGTLVSFPTNTLRITDKGLLIEDARTNLLSYSQDITAWIALSASTAVNVVSAPDGTMTVDRLTEDSSNNTHEIYKTFPISSNQVVTASVYLKNGAINGRRYAAVALTDYSASNRQTVVIDLIDGLVTDTSVSGSPISPSWGIESLDNGWLRVWITITNVALPGDGYLVIFTSNSATPSYDGYAQPTYTGDGVSNIYIWGAQVEAGTFPSSYITTTTAAATRARDAIACAGSLLTIAGGSVGTVLFDNAPLGGSGYIGLMIRYGGANYSNIFARTDINAIRLYHSDAGEIGTILGNSKTWADAVKYGISWSGSGRSVAGAGSTAVNDAAVMVVNTTMTIGDTTFPNIYTYFRRLTVWNTRLSDATLQGLTAP